MTHTTAFPNLLLKEINLPNARNGKTKYLLAVTGEDDTHQLTMSFEAALEELSKRTKMAVSQ